MAVLVACFHLFKHSFYLPSAYQLPVIFTFEGAANGEYPNGERFIIADLTGNEVLRQAADAVGAHEDILAATRIHPGNGLTHSAREALEAELQQRKLSDAKIETLNEGLAHIQREARKYAVLHVDPNKTSAPPEVIKNYLMAIPKAWSHQAVNDKSVLEIRYQAVGAPFVLDEHASIIKEVFRFEGYLKLLDLSIADLQNYGVANLSAFSGADAQKLSEIALNLDSIQTELNDLISMVPPAIDREESSTDRISESLLAAKRLNLMLELTRLRNLVQVYDDSLELLNTDIASASRDLQAQRGNELARSEARGVYAPQISDQMFDSLLRIGKSVSDSEQRATSSHHQQTH
ncbi:hypothetical protein [Motiliproteus sp. SC1-56]|uniref:hypothetical protein n=1 Tax=Motiliproteus sp. SC1-56 TaxID=2799565 RepID=UPI001A90072C|nr:hypothetical protein [Motiliproteus sp. SC1-56]